MKPMDQWTETELRQAIANAPHFRKEDTINMAVWIGCHAQAELERRQKETEQTGHFLV
tara:strand:+ start:3056 stop:3229 length:174 start_codon:yes stop_codon:yes gene_type:complete